MTPDRLAALHAASFTLPRPWSAQEFRDLLAAPRVFLLTLDDRALLMGQVVADEAELLTVAVLPEARRQGLGRRLVADFLDEARRRGAAAAFLEVAAGNAAARALYARAGFVESGRRRGYYHGPGGSDDAVVMRRALDAPRPDI
jgi:ribosomal-protein-alanine N-acetyltransferase